MTSRRLSLRRRARAAFTLLEMLIVLALIGLLTTLAVVKFGGVDENARIDMAGVFVRSSADTALLMYKQHVGRYPSTEEGLKALITPPGDAASRWRGPYIKGSDTPLDPWKKPYQYRFPGSKNKGGYDLYSWGPDGVESADDIGNWDN